LAVKSQRREGEEFTSNLCKIGKFLDSLVQQKAYFTKKTVFGTLVQELGFFLTCRFNLSKIHLLNGRSKLFSGTMFY